MPEIRTVSSAMRSPRLSSRIHLAVRGSVWSGIRMVRNPVLNEAASSKAPKWLLTGPAIHPSRWS